MVDSFDTLMKEHTQEETRIRRVEREVREGKRNPNVCDKCGRAVPENNDARYFDHYLMGGGIDILFGIPRHLLPLVEDGVVVCEGSPSRAQYLEGQPRDPRVSYRYKPELEARYREVYAEMQKTSQE